MTFFDWLFGRDSPPPTEQRSIGSQVLAGLASGYPPRSSFATVTQPGTIDQALCLSTVWACVRLLSDTVSTFPLDLYRTDSRESLPLPPLLVTPAAGTSRQEWVYMVMSSLPLRGNAYG